MFENGVTIAVGYFSDVECACFSFGDVVAVDCSDHVFEFDAICPDVLHGGRPDRAGYQREIFDAPKSIVAASGNQLVELDSGVDSESDAVAVFGNYGHISGGAFQKRTVVTRSGKEQIASLSYRFQSVSDRIFAGRIGQQAMEIIGIFEFYEIIGSPVDAQSVKRQKGCVGFNSDHLLLIIWYQR